MWKSWLELKNKKDDNVDLKDTKRILRKERNHLEEMLAI